MHGRIEIGNNCCVRANSVVNKSFPDGVTIGGNAARIISDEDSSQMIIKGTEVVDFRLAGAKRAA